jgi:hypothetical protein
MDTHIHQIYQPKGSRLCGQTCLAMLAGTSIQAVIAAVGKRGSTNVTDLARGLRQLGFDSASALTLVQEDQTWPDIYIAQVKYPKKRNWHWVLFANGALYDPCPNMRPGGRINAFLEIKGKRRRLAA